LYVQDGTAEPAVKDTGAFLLVAKVGTTNKSWSYTNAEIVDKGLTIAPEGTEAAKASYTFSLDGAPTLAQFT
jgi:hypothetical protein